MSKQVKKYILYIALLVIVSGIAIFTLLKDNPIAIFNNILSADKKYLLVGFALVLISYFLNGLFLMALTRIYNKKYKLMPGVANHLIGTFFSAITPSSTGGQFVQAYTFTKQGVSIEHGASILYMAFIIRQTISIIFSILTLSFRYNEMAAMTDTLTLFGFDFNIIYISLLGFTINTIVLLGLFFLAFSKKIHYIVVHGGINLLRKLHIFKKEKADKTKKKIDDSLAVFRVELKRLLTNWKSLLISLVIVFLDVIVSNSYPYVMAQAVGVNLEGKTIIDGICMANFVSLITTMIPIPGAAGGAELVFQVMFNGFIGDVSNNELQSINLLWRFFTFYLNLIIGFFVFIFYRGSPKTEVVENNMENIKDMNVEIHSLTEEIDLNTIYENDAIKRKNFSKKIKFLKKDKNVTNKNTTDKNDVKLNVEVRIDNLKSELQNHLHENEKDYEESIDVERGNN